LIELLDLELAQYEDRIIYILCLRNPSKPMSDTRGALDKSPQSA